MLAALEKVARLLAARGARVRELAWPYERKDGQPAFSRLAQAQRTVQLFETARALGPEAQYRREALSARLVALIEEGRTIGAGDYVEALQVGRNCAAGVDQLFGDADVVLTPSAPGEAPLGLAETGDPGFQAIWTVLYTPTMTLPTHRGPNGMPVGIQLVALPHEDRRLFAAARWVWQQIGAPELVGTR